MLWFILSRVRLDITPHIGMHASITMKCFVVRATLMQPKTAMHGHAKRCHSQAQQKIEHSNPAVRNEEEPTTSKKKTCRCLTITEVSDFCFENNIKNRTQLLLVAGEQKRHGKLDLATFVLNRSKKVICEIIETVWEMKHADRDLARLNRDRMSVIYDTTTQMCTPGCEDGVWLSSAIELLNKNKIQSKAFAAALRTLLSKGRGKFRNILLVGPTNCGKTFLLRSLCDNFKTFCNPVRDKFVWVGSEGAKIILINDLRWSPELIQWDDFLHLLEGQKAHLPASKNHFAKDVSISNDTPILATGSSTIKHVGKYNVFDDRETEMMKVRWRVFGFTRRISESDVKEIPVCPRCFSELALMV